MLNVSENKIKALAASFVDKQLFTSDLIPDNEKYILVPYIFQNTHSQYLLDSNITMFAQRHDRATPIKYRGYPVFTDYMMFTKEQHNLFKQFCQAAQAKAAKRTLQKTRILIPSHGKYQRI